MRSRRHAEPHGPTAGFTLVELMIGVAIIAVLASIAVPNYQSAVLTARFQKARHELRTIATAIDVFRSGNGGALPLTLADVGHGGRTDPWGTPYCYLNFGAGTGDGLLWAVAHKLLDPGILDGDGATLLSPELIAISNRGGAALAEAMPPPPVDTENMKRRDSYLFPLNSDYDLFSIGPNRDSHVSLGNRLSQDDVIRANDGGFFGRASEY